MKTSLTCRQLEIKPSPIHGYGVFAKQVIQTGEIIEESYALVNEKRSDVFNHYYFGTDQHSILALGYGSIYNHSNEPNAQFEVDLERELVVFRASKPIQPGEEIYIDYGDTWFGTRYTKPRQLSWGFKVKKIIFSMPSIWRFMSICLILGLLLTIFRI